MTSQKHQFIVPEPEKLDCDELFALLKTSPRGLNSEEALSRLSVCGRNELATTEDWSRVRKVVRLLTSPFTILLVILAILSYLAQNMGTTGILIIMVCMSIILQYFHEARAEGKVQVLRKIVALSSNVIRDGSEQEIDSSFLVPGDIIHLSAGDLVPADVCLISAKNFFVNEATITGEPHPKEKSCIKKGPDTCLRSGEAADIAALCYYGSNVDSGTADAVVVRTGAHTEYGSIVKAATTRKVTTEFDKGINRFTWLMISLMIIIAPLVFLINGTTKGNWVEAFLFSLAVVVGLIPEMLPLIVTLNLSKGAVSMSGRSVIVKRLNAIQNFGAMNILCTDKTGTLTEGRVVLARHLNPAGEASLYPLNLAALTSRFQTGLRNLVDTAILQHDAVDREILEGDGYRKIDEIPFDFRRKRMSVIVQHKNEEPLLVCKGAVDEILPLCTHCDISSGDQSCEGLIAGIPDLTHSLYREGFRILAVAYRKISPEKGKYGTEDECDLTLAGLLAFLDPPKETTPVAIRRLTELGITIKILTGDHDEVTRTICHMVDLPVTGVLTGSDISSLDDRTLARAAKDTTIFARLLPDQKDRVIRALKSDGNVVGFMGDGINDVPAMRAADVSISVNSAVDIAKEFSDIILLKQSLLVLAEGVVEGRRVFGNITKYIRMAATFNFGYIFSILGSSIFLPFLPVLPIQALLNNLLYDFSQTAIPTDNVDPEWVSAPRRWDISDLKRFFMVFGPISSVFDYITFAVLIFVFGALNNPAFFQTGWFVESVLIMTLSVHVLRTEKIPILGSRASVPLMLTTTVVALFGLWLPYSPLRDDLGLVPLPAEFWAYLAVIFLCYLLVTQGVKMIYYRKIRQSKHVSMTK